MSQACYTVNPVDSHSHTKPPHRYMYTVYKYTSMHARVHNSICSFYSLIELAITVSKNQNKTSGAASSRGYKSGGGGGGAMKMSQSELLKDSVSAWSINMPGVSKKTRGSGRNGTEQRALEGIQNNSKRRAIRYSVERRAGYLLTKSIWWVIMFFLYVCSSGVRLQQHIS